MSTLIAISAPVSHEMRDPFLRALALELEKHPATGPGLIHRLGRELQPQFFDPNVAIGSRKLPRANAPGRSPLARLVGLSGLTTSGARAKGVDARDRVKMGPGARRRRGAVGQAIAEPTFRRRCSAVRSTSGGVQIWRKISRARRYKDPSPNSCSPCSL
jgi:hypothetical protein